MSRVTRGPNSAVTSLGGGSRWDTPTSWANTVGLLAIGQEATSKQQRTDFGLADVDDDDFKSWFLELKENEYRDRGGGPRRDVAVRSRGRRRSGVRGRGVQRLRGAAQAKNISVVVPTPMTTADVVFAPVRNRAGSDGFRAVATGDAACSALADAASRGVADPGQRAVCAAVGPVRLTTSSNLPAAGAGRRPATGPRAVVEAGKAIVCAAPCPLTARRAILDRWMPVQGSWRAT